MDGDLAVGHAWRQGGPVVLELDGPDVPEFIDFEPPEPCAEHRRFNCSEPQCR